MVGLRRTRVRRAPADRRAGRRGGASSSGTDHSVREHPGGFRRGPPRAAESAPLPRREARAPPALREPPNVSCGGITLRPRGARRGSGQPHGEPGKAMSRINVLWVIDHVCYDGSLHGGGRLYWNVLQHFEDSRVHVVPCLLRATEEIRRVFRDSPVPVRVLDKGKFDPTTLWTLLRLIREHDIHVLHLHCYGASTFGRLASALTGVPVVVHDYDTEVYFPYPWYHSLADRVLAPRTDRAVASSPMVREFQAHKRKIAEGRILERFHAIPPGRYAPVAADRIAAIRETLHLCPNERLVGTPTKLGPQRGNDVQIG